MGKFLQYKIFINPDRYDKINKPVLYCKDIVPWEGTGHIQVLYL